MCDGQVSLKSFNILTQGFFSMLFFVYEHSQFTEQPGKGEGISYSSLPLPPASQILRY